MNRSKLRAILIAGMALFAMYFGAGNLIFPVMIGVEAGLNLRPALIGFILTGVALPILGMVAVATSSRGIDGLSSRLGKIPGLVFTIVIFLSTGMLYAIPRVATVSYEMTVKPMLEEGSSSSLPLLLYTAVFFPVAYAIAVNPKGMIDRIGKWLTPSLLTLLVAMIAATLWRGVNTAPTAAPTYQDGPLSTGLILGYFTMDAIASLVFGLVIIQSLRQRGFTSGRSVFLGTVATGALAGTALAAIYTGLALIGVHVNGRGASNGAEALTMAANELFGRGGQAVFGLIALLACLTTAVGLLGASSSYFQTLFPKIRRRHMVAIHVVVSFALANLGLEAILAIVAPLNQLIYPIAISLIFVTLLDMPIPRQLFYSYRLPAAAAAVIGLGEALWSTTLPVFAPLRAPLDALPLGSSHLPWVAPALVALLVGLALDFKSGARSK
ncbi:MAG: branched-chain amino acid transport system II carrier protein [Actinomycetaceae bacterium]|nr:branched-chain amino acid transport system II carrier protein [Actinomycetaceae bacterium]